MVNVRDFRRFRFWSCDYGRRPMTLYLHLYITNKSLTNAG